MMDLVQMCPQCLAELEFATLRLVISQELAQGQLASYGTLGTKEHQTVGIHLRT